MKKVSFKLLHSVHSINILQYTLHNEIHALIIRILYVLKVCLPALRRFWAALLALRWAADAWPMKPDRVEARRQVLDNFIVCVECSMSMTFSLRMDYERWVWFFHFGTPSTFTRANRTSKKCQWCLVKTKSTNHASHTMTAFPVIITHWYGSWFFKYDDSAPQIGSRRALAASLHLHIWIPPHHWTTGP